MFRSALDVFYIYHLIKSYVVKINFPIVVASFNLQNWGTFLICINLFYSILSVKRDHQIITMYAKTPYVTFTKYTFSGSQPFLMEHWVSTHEHCILAPGAHPAPPVYWVRCPNAATQAAAWVRPSRPLCAWALATVIIIRVTKTWHRALKHLIWCVIPHGISGLVRSNEERADLIFLLIQNFKKHIQWSTVLMW